jgi:inner membrane protein YhjD
VAKRSSTKQERSGGVIASLLALVAMIAVALGAWRRPSDNGARPAAVVASAPGTSAPAFISKIDHWQRRRRFVSFVVGVVKKFGDDRAGYLAALVSYFAFLSILPLFLALTSVLGFVLQDDPDLQKRITDSAFGQVPLIGETIQNNVQAIKGSVSAIVVGALVSVWAGLRVVDAIQNALNEVWDVPLAERPNIVKRRARGLAMLGVFGLGLLASMAAASLAALLPNLPGAGRLIVYVVTFLYNVVLFLLAFRVLSSVEHRWGEILPGAVVAAAGWFLMQTFGALYLTRVLDKASHAYTNFAGVIGLLTFFFLVSQLVIFAAEVNVVRTRRLWPRSLLASPDDLTDADRRAFADYAASEIRVKGQLVEIGFDGDGSRMASANSNGGARKPARR